ncbi:MAG: ATP-binding protein [candidate division KSB1 bacterium]|nr:ATP-binding protein [candidate division KSB1 bacterium]MDZ7364492.1 ATP-binding protein [candidate division KSB1 bacterium]MDZ7402864.1 ATP-binding protein [candidate division KSB1 bacterium]
MKHLFIFAIFLAGWTSFDPVSAPNAPSSVTSDVTTSDSPARNNEAGKVFITNYRPKDYGAHAQNLAIVQDDRGVMYFGNVRGVLEYDGVSWRLIQLPNKSLVRSLAKDKNGRIYVGGVGDFGYLAPDSVGQMRFVSLLAYVEEADKKFADVWNTGVTPQGVYFQANNALFRWANQRIDVWKPRTSFHLSFIVRETLYVRQWQAGLMRMAHDSLQLVAEGERFADERIYLMLPFDEKNILIGTRTQGLFLHDGAALKPFRTEAEALLAANQLYLPGARLHDGTLALGTLRGGVAIIDRQGRLLRVIDKAAGLLNDTVSSLFTDREGALWLALDNGLARVEAVSPFTFFDEQSGLKNPLAYLLRHRGIFYAATNVGVFYLHAASREFRPVEGIAAQCLSLLPVDDMLLAATLDGVYRIDRDRAAFVKPSVNNSYRALVLHRSRQNNHRIFVGLDNGLAALRFENAAWIDEGKVSGVQERIIRLVENPPGSLWLGTSASGVRRVDIAGLEQNQNAVKNAKVESFGFEQGLPAGGVAVFAVADKEYFVSQDGVFRFDSERRRFFPDSTFNLVSFGGSVEEYFLREDHAGRVWINFGRETAVARPQAGGGYIADNMVLKNPSPHDQPGAGAPLRKFSNEPFFCIYPEPDGIVWLGGPNGLIRYDTNVVPDHTAPYPALIRRVIVGEDSLLFGGAVSTPGPNISILPFTNNAIRFEFAATNYEEAADNQFQTFLEGFDKFRPAGTLWSRETKKEYINLPPGEYRFHVRAKNIYERLSDEAVYAFKILPPWYRSWWAYLFYVVAAGAVIFGLIRFRTRQLQARSQMLEKNVRERTAEIRAQKENVEQLSQIGKEITASLEFETIFYKLYEHVNSLADAGIFGVGIYHPDKNQIEYKLAIAKGKRYAPYTRDMSDKNQFPVWCIENRRPVFINDVQVEYSRYIGAYQHSGRLLEDGTRSEAPLSLIYLPLIAKDRVLGVITIQSFQKNAYTEYHLNLLQNLAAYTTIALDNADAYRRLNVTLEHLKATQQQLITQEKLASLGALTAGIAHEMKNPLNFINNFAELSVELMRELREGFERQKEELAAEARAELEETLRLLELNVTKINEHGKRADSIVRNMLLHSRGETSERRPADLNAILDEYVMLAYHGMRGTDATFNIKIEKDYDSSIGRIEIFPQDLSRAFLNLINNACYATHQKKKKLGEDYAPVLAVATKNAGDRIEIRIRDNGPGIARDVRDKIFTPFFTTKPAGEGTGLGLSISYDIIVQLHHGEIRVESEEGHFTEFVISLPRG